MNRMLGSLLLVLTAVAAVPAAAGAQNRPSNNLWTRSAELYLDRARQNSRPEEKQALYEQAREALQEGAEKDGDNPKVWYLLGEAQANLGNFAAADSAFDRAEALFSPYDEVQTARFNAWATAYNRGVATLSQNDIPGAIAHFEAADELYQGRPLARVNLGALYARQGETERAINAYRGALEILRGPAAEKLSEEDRAEWREIEATAVFNLAQLLALAGRDAEAAEAYQELLARDPNNAIAKQNLAVVLARQGNAEEARRLFGELLADPNLDAEDYFNLGIGLYQAEDYERAAEAFRLSLQKNEHGRDARYNLAQALYAQVTELEEQRANASGAQAQEIDARLLPLYREVGELAAQLAQVDPQNRNIVALEARAFRGLSDATSNAQEKTALKAREVAALERYENMAFELSELATESQEGQVRFTGKIKNISLAAGAPVKLQVTLLGEGGAPLATQEIEVPAPAPEQSSEFESTFAVEQPVLGWRYQVSP